MKKKKGFTRLFYAAKYSMQGFKSALLNEVAFRQEMILIVFMTCISFLFDITGLERLFLIGSIMMVLLVELLNSAIECIVDRVSLEHHELSGRAKDYGSLAVFLSLCIAVATWLVVLLSH